MVSFNTTIYTIFYLDQDMFYHLWQSTGANIEYGMRKHLYIHGMLNYNLGAYTTHLPVSKIYPRENVLIRIFM